MSTDEPPAHRAPVDSAVPWWLGRGVGVLLALTVGAVLWTVCWLVAAQTEDPPVPSATSPMDHGTDAWPVSYTTDDDEDEPDPVPTTPAETGSDSTSDSGTDLGALGGVAPSGDHALQAEVLRTRRAERIERARQSDKELAAFIESVGVLEPLELWVSPLSAEYRITATFGQSGSLWSADHTGVDLAAPSGTPVGSVAAGTVTGAGDAGAYGLQVEVTHPDGTVTSYSHLSRIDVTEGQVLQQGGAVGAVGSTGNSTGPHLHLELRPTGGVPVDPVAALLARGVVL